MKILVSSIAWDTDGAAADELDLPTELDIDTNAEGITDHQKLCEWLSDKHGWTVVGLSCNPPLSGAA